MKKKTQYIVLMTICLLAKSSLYAGLDGIDKQKKNFETLIREKEQKVKDMHSKVQSRVKNAKKTLEEKKAFAKQKFGNLPESILIFLTKESNRHTTRMATIDQIEELSRENGYTQLLDKTHKMRLLEIKRYEKIVEKKMKK